MSYSIIRGINRNNLIDEKFVLTKAKGCKMSDCELLSTCPFFNDKTQDMTGITEPYKEQYCKGSYAWCGRYLTYKVSEKELKKIKRLDVI